MAGWEQLGGRRFRKRPQLPSLLFLLLLLVLLLLLLLLFLPLGCLYPYWGRGGGDEPGCPAAAAVSSATTAAMKRKTSGVGGRRHSAPATLPATAPPAFKKTRSTAALPILGEAEEQSPRAPRREICLQIAGEEWQRKGRCGDRGD